MSRRNKEKVNSNQVMTSDAFSNPMFRLGFGTQAPLEATEYPLTRLTDNYALLNSMYRSGGILQSVVDIIPEDMCREWFTLQGDISAQDIDAFEKAQRKMGLRKQIYEGLRWGRLYGGAAGLMLIDGQDDLEKPLDLEAVMPDSFKGLYILDRWNGIYPGSELVTDIGDPDFGLPKYYEINSGEGTSLVAKVHHSRIVRFIGRELPYLERLAELYWGESEVEPIYEDIALYDSVMQNMGNLTFRANVDTMEVQNLDQLFAVGSIEQQKRFWSVMQAQSVATSNFGTRLINKGDAIHNQQYSFTGFDHVVEAVQLNLSAKTHIPMTKLFGRSPAGLSATGESDMQNYYDIIDGQREQKLRPVLERIFPVLCMSVWGAVPEDAQISFPPLWTPTAMELAQIAGAKSQAIIAAYQSGLLNLGPAQAELKKLEDETGMFGSIEDELIEKNKDTTFMDTQQMQDPLAGLFGSTEDDSSETDEEGSNEDIPFLTSDYDPNQPRDDFGRWTSGGGTQGNSKINTESTQSNGSMPSGAVSGALNPRGKRAAEHAERYYEEMRHRRDDVPAISKNTGFSEEDILSIKDYVFINEHDLGNGRMQRFEPNYAMSESWRRLIEGKDIQLHDITMLRHELMELNLVRQGLTQDEAHRKTSKVYNYKAESERFYGKIKKYHKE